MICIPLRQKQNLAPTTLLNIISIIKTQNAHYRVGNLNQKFKYSYIWAPMAPNIFNLWVWGETGANWVTFDPIVKKKYCQFVCTAVEYV